VALPALDSPSHADANASASAAPADDVVVPPAPVEPQASTTQPKADGPAKSDAPAKADVHSPPRSAETRTEARTDAAAAAGKRSSAKTEAPKVASAKPQADANTPARNEAGAAKAPAKASPTSTSTAAAPAAGSRFALQLGAFANVGSARAQLDKARRTGLRAYTETVSTTQGERTRVRVGPFTTRDEAEKARATLKLAGIDSSIVDAR